MDGFDSSLEIKKFYKKEKHFCYIVLMTGYNLTMEDKNVKKCKADSVITKPAT